MSPRPVSCLTREDVANLKGVFCDIDDTLTWEGRLIPAAFQALSNLQEAGLRVVPITGRPAGWVDLIARSWPVDGCVGENGGLWFYMNHGKLIERYVQPLSTRKENRQRLDTLADQIVNKVPGCALASDQPYRALDLAIDFAEDVPLMNDSEIDQIVAAFDEIGATSKVSSIHVNGWFGEFDKLAGCRGLVKDLWGEDLEKDKDKYLYFGDSANDEPMFEFFTKSIGVANVAAFLPRLKSHPKLITMGNGGYGFQEAIERVLELRSS